MSRSRCIHSVLNNVPGNAVELPVIPRVNIAAGHDRRTFDSVQCKCMIELGIIANYG